MIRFPLSAVSGIDFRQHLKILSDLYSFSVAKGGKQGITLLKKGIIPNLILLDIAMPEMDGYMTLEKIKGIPGCEEVPVIFSYRIFRIGL